MAQRGAAPSLAGTYAVPSPCIDCDSTVTTLKLECGADCSKGSYTLTEVGYDEGFKNIKSKHRGHWYVLANSGAAKDEPVKVIVLDILGCKESYPLFLVQDNGNLLEIRQTNPGRFPLCVVKENGELYVSKKGNHRVSIRKGTTYKDNPYYHVYTKRK